MCVLFLLNDVVSEIIGPIPDDRLKEKFLNPERVSSVFTFVPVCLCVRLYAGYRGHLLT